MAAGQKRWLPLEANPDVMTQFSRGLGLPAGVSFNDVLGLDDDLLAMVPRPVLAVLMLFPLANQGDAEGGKDDSPGVEVPPGAFFVKQTIGNACGTIGLLHAIANARPSIPPAEGSFLERFLKATASLSPAERGRYLEESTELEVAHSSAAVAGDTRAPGIEEDTNLHFIAFSVIDGVLYEWDGRKAGPVPHGPSSPTSVLEDSVKVVKEFMARNPDSLQFNLIAMCS